MDAFDALLALSPDPVVLADESGTVLDANAPAEATLGADAETLAGAALSAVLPVPDAADDATPLAPPAPGEGPRHLAAVASPPGAADEAIPLSVTLATRTADDERRVVATCRPADRDAADGPAHAADAGDPPCSSSEERYRRLLASSPAPIVIYDEAGDIVYANDAAAALTGEPDPQALVGTAAGEYIHPDDRPASREGVRAALERGETVEGVERRLRTADGETRHVVLSAVPATFEGDRAGQVVLSDVTRLKEREQELERQNDRLDRFVSIVSHDLRNPLTVLTSSLELAAETEDDAEHVARARRATDRMEQLVDGLLTLARQGQMPVETEPVALADVAEAAWATVDTAAATLDVRVTGTIEADRSRLRQLLENLFHNAVTHGGDDVTVTVAATDAGFAVADDGPGVDPADREAVFENGYSTVEGGTGLGLAIVREIADAHGWDVTLTESEAGGTRFVFEGATVR